MELNLLGKNVLITAASKGIGKATAERFIKEGCNVAICSRNQENLSKAAHEIKSLYNKEPLCIVCDINKLEDIVNTFKVVNETFGAIDILVNNCGGPRAGYFEELSDDDWDFAFKQILMSAVRFIRLVLPAMKERKWGRIINITSVSVKQPIDNLILSNSMRNAVTALAKTLSNQVGKYNITINNVAPGYTLTSRIYELSEIKAKQLGTTQEAVLSSMAEEVPVKRLASPHEVAALIAFLASDHAGYITGSTIAIDGGVIKATY
ncbi:MAG: SDR family oxidoreductase [Melioribacter sp.]|nr:SDR family oxidoreductase [Melioribacter sp.]